MSIDARQNIELFHLLFLDQLGRKLDKRLYALKGGCNLRFFFKSIRYSEDIDLDIKTIQLETLQKKVRNIITAKPFIHILQSRGITVTTLSEPKQTKTTQRWKIGLNVDNVSLPLHTKIEFSRRGLDPDVEFGGINRYLTQLYQLTPILLNHYGPNAAFWQKILALTSRNETQARDVFDLYLLVTTNYDQLIFSKKKLPLVSKAIELLLTVTYQDFKSQVLSYLSAEQQTQYNSKNIWNNIIMQLIEFMESMSS